MKLIITSLLVLFNSGSLLATNYYFSDRGNDINTGTSKATPWQSLTYLATRRDLIKSGDSIFFERGSEFIGTLSITGSGVYIGAYGLGKKPIIKGSVKVVNWVSFKKNIWKSYCKQCIKEPANVFIDGKSQPLGRYPNQGYLAISKIAENQQSFIDNTLSGKDNFWTHSEVVIRSSRWTIDKLPVSSYKNNTFNYSLAPSYSLENGFGYFIQKHLSTLDQSGEWFSNYDTHELFLYLDEGLKPGNNIEFSFHELGLELVNANHVTVDGLIFKNHQSGCLVKNSRNITLRNIEQFNSGKNGLEIIASENPTVENSVIADSNNNGVVWLNNAGGSFICNEILRTGLTPGRGMSGNGSYIALHITANKISTDTTLFQSNKIDRSGYTGIDFRTGHTILKDNHISNFCLTKDDGGGIYTWENEQLGNLIEGNIITNGMGSGEGTPNRNQRFASGIYIDDRSSNIVIYNNTILRCATAGIYLHNARVITVSENNVSANGYTFANKEKGQLYIRLDKHKKHGEKKELELTISRNNFITEHENSYCIYLSADEKQDLEQLGTFTENQFSGHTLGQAVAKSYHRTDPCLAPEVYTLEKWQQISLKERGSSFNINRTNVFKIVSKNLVSNGNMTKDINGWTIWPEKQILKQDRITAVDNPSLNVLIDSLNTEALVYHGGFSVGKEKLYKLTFTAWSSASMQLEFVPLMATSPWRALSDYSCFTLDSKRKSFIYYFMANEQSEKVRVNFKSNQSFWIDEVTLHEIVETNKSDLPL